MIRISCIFTDSKEIKEFYHMYVCVCHGITEKEVLEAIKDGSKGIRDLRQNHELGSECGKCIYIAARLIRDNKPVLNYDLAKAV